MSRLVNTLYPLPDQRRTASSLLYWWESRRLIYNGIVAAAGLVTLTGVTVFALMPGGFGFMPIGEVLLFALAYGIAANVCYSLGWMVELVARWVWGTAAPNLGPFLFREGVFFSVGITLIPLAIAAVLWVLRFVALFIS